MVQATGARASCYEICKVRLIGAGKRASQPTLADVEISDVAVEGGSGLVAEDVSADGSSHYTFDRAMVSKILRRVTWVMSFVVQLLISSTNSRSR